jgi:AraC-like DNA-binding protein
MIIVDFLPGALYRLMNIPFIEFTNRDMDAEDVLPAAFRKINERLANATSYESMITVIENFLLSLLKRSKNEYRPIDHILATITEDPDHSMEWMIHNGFLSLRQLERKFNERVGVNPKTFLRIARFHQSYLMYLKRTSLNWFQIAMNCGYTDYQHLVRDYKQFTNTTPNQFFMQERNSPGRVLGLTNYPR